MGFGGVQLIIQTCISSESQTRQLLKHTGACPGVRRVAYVIFSNLIIYSRYLVYICISVGTFIAAFMMLKLVACANAAEVVTIAGRRTGNVTSTITQ